MASGLPASLVFGPPSKKSPGQAAKAKPRADADIWRAEYERVKDSLVIAGDGGVSGGGGPAEWRADLERAKATLRAVTSTASEARVALEDIGQGLTAKLQQLGELEGAVNRELQGSMGAGGGLERELAALRQEHDSKQEYVTELKKELAFLNGEMEERRRQLEEQGDSMASTKPLAQLRDAVDALRAELVQMDVRTGLLQHLVVKAM